MVVSGDELDALVAVADSVDDLTVNGSCTVVFSRCAVLTSLRTLTTITSPPTVMPFALPRYRLPGTASLKRYPASLISSTVPLNASVGVVSFQRLVCSTVSQQPVDAGGEEGGFAVSAIPLGFQQVEVVDGDSHRRRLPRRGFARWCVPMPRVRLARCGQDSLDLCRKRVARLLAAALRSPVEEVDACE
jgi:hypothetical protein